MKKIFFILFFSLLLYESGLPVYSQNTVALEEKTYPENTKHELVKILPMNAGGYTLFGNTISGDKGGYDIFIQQSDRNLNVVSETFFGSEADEYIFDAFQSLSGNIAFFGKKEAIVNNTARWNIFYKTISQDGKKEYYQEYVSFENDSISQSLELENGDVIFIGNKEDWGDNDQNIWLLKINKKGIIKWQVNLGERYIDEIGLDIGFDGASFYILAELRERGKTTPLLLKTDLTGNLEYKKEIPGMQGYQSERIFLTENNDFIVLGSKKTSGTTTITAFRIDKSARKISETSFGSIDQDAAISFTGNAKSLYALSNLNGKGCIYNYVPETDEVNFSEFKQNIPVEYVNIIVEDKNFLAGGNSSSGDNTLVYLQKNELIYTTPPLTTATTSSALARTESGVARIEVLEPSNSMGIARLSNASSVTLKLKVNSDIVISKVFVNNVEMLSLGNSVYSNEFKLKEGFNNCKFKAIDEDGHVIFQHMLIENTLGNAEPQGLAKGKNYALIMTVNEYTDPLITDLDNPYTDGKSLASTLQSLYTFDSENTFFLIDPSREEIITKFDQLVYEIGEEDNFLVFFAGHGYWDKKTNIGYWLPSDAKQSNTANWLSNSTIKDFISAIHSKHTLLIADACFSGGIFKTRKAFNDNIGSVDKLYKLPSRKAMTSGTLTEVPDKSVFIEYLLKRLHDNDQKYISSEELFSSMRTAVLNNSDNVPQYGEIKDSGDEGGDFIFIHRE